MVFIVRYWAGHVKDSDNTGGRGVCGGSENCIPKCSWESWGGWSPLRDQSVHVNIILKWIILKWMLEMWDVGLATGSIMAVDLCQNEAVWSQSWTFVLHRIYLISWSVEWLLGA